MYNGCTRPLKAFPIGITKNNKTEYKITNYDCDHLEKSNGKWIQVGVPEKHFSGETLREFVELPCGRCPGCLLNRARQWRDRCIAESFYHKSNYFLTLTYDDEHVPFGPSGNMTLRKKDLQDFWKRLRHETDVRYFACGEYGDTTHRPHYHAIAFGLDLPDITLNDFGHLESRILTSKWSNGMVSIGEVNEKTCGYVARYTYKKAFKDLQLFYDTFQVEPEFTVMSRRPGIGSTFFDDEGLYLYNNGKFPYSTEDGGRALYPTRYWQSLLERNYPELYEEVKKNGLEYSLNKRLILFKNDKRPIADILKDQEEIITKRTTALRKRDLDEF